MKVSDELFRVAKEEAAAENRSITAQVEHWARVGRAVEAVLAHGELLGLKRAGSMLTPVFPRADRRRQVHALLTKIAAENDRSPVTKRIHDAGGVVYAGSPGSPGRVVQVHPDGTRILGRMEGRRFVADAAAAPKRRGARRTR